MKKSTLFVLLCAFLLSGRAVANETSFEFHGNHFLGSYSECDYEALTNVEALMQAMKDAAKESGATILSCSEKVFPPNGLTMVILLSESHASIHTYPEHGACFVDLFTCGENCDALKFDNTLRNYLKPKKVSAKILARNYATEEKIHIGHE